MTDRARTERRIAAFVEGGLDDFRIRAWAVIRGAYLIGDPEQARVLPEPCRLTRPLALPVDSVDDTWPDLPHEARRPAVRWFQLV